MELGEARSDQGEEKQALGVIVTEPLNTTYKQARRALGVGHRGATEVREGQGSAVRARSWRGLRLRSLEGLCWRRPGCLWRPRSFTSSSWTKS